MRIIKKIIVCFFTIAFTGCSLEDDNTNFFYELANIEQVDLPDEFIRGMVYDISVSFFRPTDCHSFNGFNFDRRENEVTVAAVNVVITDRECTDLDQTDLIEESFEFAPGRESSYVFRFWQDQNDNGDVQYLIVEVPVIEQ